MPAHIPNHQQEAPQPLTGRAIQAAEPGGQQIADLQRISGVAYSGGPLTQWWSSYPIYMNLATLQVRPQIPLLYNHYNSPNSRLGTVSANINNSQHRLEITGGIDPEAQDAQKLIAAGKKIPWQLSIGSLTNKVILLKEEEETTVNGRTITGPAYIVDATLYEVSLVAVGADAETHLQIHAVLNLPTPSSNQLSSTTAPPSQPEETTTMPTSATNTPAAAPPAVNAAATPPPANNPTPAVQAAAPAVQAAAPAVQAAAPAVQAAAPTPAPPPDVAAAAVQEERVRVAQINRICARFPNLATQAAAEGWTIAATQAAVINAINADYTPSSPNIRTETPNVSQTTIEAALMTATGTAEADIIATCGEPALQAAHTRWRGTIGLQEVILEAAAANGVPNLPRRLSTGNWHDITARAIQASGTGFSTVSLPGLLGGVISRSLIEGFGAIDESWRAIADITPVRDFREIVSYRLTSDGDFEEVGATGELQHGTLDETSFRNQAKTYGKMLGLTRQDIINDDLGALTSIPKRLGFGAALRFNQVFWKEFLDNASFFTDGNKNLIANNPLGVAGLSAALKVFRLLKDENKLFVGARPTTLLVPPSLEVLAGQLHKDSQVIAVGVISTKAVTPSGNPHAGKYQPVVSPYLEDPDLSGYSSTAYYLLADPKQRATIQAVFLNNNQTPVVESSEMVFNQLGIQFRAYYDFGVKKMDHLAGVKVAGTSAE